MIKARRRGVVSDRGHPSFLTSQQGVGDQPAELRVGRQDSGETAAPAPAPGGRPIRDPSADPGEAESGLLAITSKLRRRRSRRRPQALPMLSDERSWRGVPIRRRGARHRWRRIARHAAEPRPSGSSRRRRSIRRPGWRRRTRPVRVADQARRCASRKTPSSLGCPRAQSVDQVDAGDALRQPAAEQRRAPDERLAVGDDDTARSTNDCRRESRRIVISVHVDRA